MTIGGNSVTGFAPVNGAQLFYEVSGSGDPLILIHGFGLDRRMWDNQFISFAQSYSTVRYDLRGFGKSSLPAQKEYSHHHDLHRLLMFLGINRAHVAGLSVGGRVAIDFALTYPSMVSSLVLADTVVHGYKFQNYTQEAIAKAAKESGVEAGKQLWLDSDLFQTTMQYPEQARLLKEIIHDYSGWHFLNKNPWRPIEPPALQQLSKIGAPTLVLYGDHDLPDFQSLSKIVGETIPGARSVIIHGAGHMCNMEQPDEFNDTILQFFNSIRYHMRS